MYYLSMNELIKTLEKAKAQGRNVIWEDGYEEITVCIQEEYAEYTACGTFTFKDRSECDYNTGANAKHPDSLLRTDFEATNQTFVVCELFEKF